VSNISIILLLSGLGFGIVPFRNSLGLSLLYLDSLSLALIASFLLFFLKFLGTLGLLSNEFGLFGGLNLLLLVLDSLLFSNLLKGFWDGSAWAFDCLRVLVCVLKFLIFFFFFILLFFVFLFQLLIGGPFLTTVFVVFAQFGSFVLHFIDELLYVHGWSKWVLLGSLGGGSSCLLFGNGGLVSVHKIVEIFNLIQNSRDMAGKLVDSVMGLGHDDIGWLLTAQAHEAFVLLELGLLSSHELDDVVGLLDQC
jgi:hypothetical protein